MLVTAPSLSHSWLCPNSITPTLQQSPGQVPDKVADVSQTQVMKVRDTNHVADFRDLCRRLSPKLHGFMICHRLCP